ncbi:MAG TPA: hypothetical protein VM143_13040 [Acidimicrobiales bacterium]|nr:hypothetical protein [Acidimicrobiales bacterium]
MRRFVDDAADDHPAGDDDKAPASWSVALLDDCDGCQDLRIVLTVEPAGEHGAGIVAHLAPENALRLRRALATALREIGVDPA